MCSSPRSRRARKKWEDANGGETKAYEQTSKKSTKKGDSRSPGKKGKDKGRSQSPKKDKKPPMDKNRDCPYFKKPGGCKFGDSCKYRH